MHLMMIIFALGVVFVTRWRIFPVTGSLDFRWYYTLLHFLFAPLLLITTAIAVLWMGHHGTMLGMSPSRVSCGIAIAFCLFAVIWGIYLAYQGNKTVNSLKNYPQKRINGQTVRIVDTAFPYSAQIGFWQSELIITQGLLNLLNCDQLMAVLAHEKAHEIQRDTFWFFWLGWLQKITAWLPNSQVLWQELLLLREIRADHYAMCQTDALVLAESLLLVAQKMQQYGEDNFAYSGVAFHENAIQNRLAERIDWLLNSPPTASGLTEFRWGWIGLTLLPLMTIPLHH